MRYFAGCSQSIWNLFAASAHNTTAPLNVMFSCERCAAILHSKKALTNHLLVIHAQSKHECKTCGKLLSTPAVLQQHIKRLHSNQLPSLICKICQTKFLMPKDLENHVQIHLPESEQFTCEACHKNFSVRRKLKDHQLKCAVSFTSGSFFKRSFYNCKNTCIYSTYSIEGGLTTLITKEGIKSCSLYSPLP